MATGRVDELGAYNALGGTRGCPIAGISSCTAFPPIVAWRRPRPPSGATRAITEFAHPAPQLRDVHKELVTYPRNDGLDLSATLYLPPGHEPGVDAPLPLIVWAYPREFNDPYTAGQVRGSPYRFTTIRGSSHLFLLLEGYAIMDAAIGGSR